MGMIDGPGLATGDVAAALAAMGTLTPSAWDSQFSPPKVSAFTKGGLGGTITYNANGTVSAYTWGAASYTASYNVDGSFNGFARVS